MLETVSGLPIKLVDDLPSPAFQQPFGFQEQEFIVAELQRLLSKEVIAASPHEPGEYISPIFVRPKGDGTCRLILNLKKLNRVTEYIHFKMETLLSILRLVTPGCYMAKVDNKDAYYSIPIRIQDQKLIKFIITVIEMER